jgi:hypothetical protein
LIAGLGDPSGDVCEACAAALGALRAKDATPELLKLIWNPDSGRLDEIFAALGKIGIREPNANSFDTLMGRAPTWAETPRVLSHP